MSKLEYLEPLKPLPNVSVMKRPEKDSTTHNELFTPINVFGCTDDKTSKNHPEPPNLQTLKNQRPKFIQDGTSKRMNPLYYKTKP